MEFEYQLNIKDYQEANQAHLNANTNIFVLIIPVGILIYTLLQLFASTDIYEVITVLVMLLVLFIIIYFATSFMQRYVVTRTWKNQPSIQSPIAVEVSEEWIFIKTLNIESRVKWPVYTHFRETSNLFMLYQSPAIFNIFPKRAFSSEQQIAEFREFLDRKVKKVR